KVAQVLIETGKIKLNDQLLITGETTGLIEMNLSELFLNEESVNAAGKGDEITFITPGLVRRNDKVYMVEYQK
ncbi:MAG: U32 family peptidase, partial [Ignavibacteriaceae bacterium]|nr:U32 family peptidase [Ignavibacteriaceae bacterium]